MKRKIKFLSFLVFLFLLIPTLSSCTYINSLIRIANDGETQKSVPNTELTVNYHFDDQVNTVKTTDRNRFEFPEKPTKEGYTFGGWTYKDSYQTLSKDDIIYKTETSIDLYAYFSEGDKYHFSDNLNYNGPYFSKNGLPSLGKPKVLVVPVNLGGSTDKSSYTPADMTMIDEIKKAFNGTSEETGFESVSSYYKKSSNNKLELEFDVVDEWFTPKNSPSYYEKYDSKNDKYYEAGSGLILNEFIQAYDSKYDFSQYDYDKNGYIDAVWMIYNVEPNYNDTTFYWAYVTYSQNTSKKYDGCYPRHYGFASYYFIHEYELSRKQRREIELYDMSDITYDAHTYIHETGHLMGLSDFYDSDKSKGGTGGLYGAGMMDANQGDMNTIDKLLLGWIDPYVCYTNSDVVEFNIRPFTETGDVILISKNKPGSIYNEYFLLELYTNTGLNSHDKPIDLPSSTLERIKLNLENKRNVYGIRLLHINATTSDEYNGKTYNQQMDFVYNNSTTRNLFVDMIVNSKTAYETKASKTIVNSYALITDIDKEINLKGSTYKMTNQSDIFFNFKITELTENNAKINIIF